MILFPDSIVNYMTTFVKKEWMVANEFYNAEELFDGEHMLHGKTGKDFDFLKEVPMVKVDEDITVGECLKHFENGVESVALVDGSEFKGMINRFSVNKFMFGKKLKMTDSAKNCKVLEVWRVPMETDFSVV